MRTIVTITMLGMTLFAAVPYASAFGMRGGGPAFGAGPDGPGGPGGPHGRPLRLLVSQMTPDQRRQVRQILFADRGEMRKILEQLHDAHEALSNKVLAPGALSQADLEPQLRKIASLHEQLVEHGAKVMLQVRAIATPEQLAKAVQTKQQVDKLHDQIRTLLGESSMENELPPE